MRILGIDPGHTRLGLGLVELKDGEIEFVAHGLIEHPRRGALKFNEHLNEGIYLNAVEFPKVLQMMKPDRIAAEIVPVGRLGSNSELVVAIITVCKVIAYQFGIPWTDYGANTVKERFTGNGTATKARVRQEVFKRYPITKERHDQMRAEQKAAGVLRPQGLPFDMSDAIAIAYTGALEILNETTNE